MNSQIAGGAQPAIGLRRGARHNSGRHRRRVVEGAVNRIGNVQVGLWPLMWSWRLSTTSLFRRFA